MSAIFSMDRRYRYVLSRQWGDTGRTIAFIGLNPSTADEKQDDPTIRRCIGYAKDWGFGGLRMLNLFAFRATDPAVMKAEPLPVGCDNDWHLLDSVNHCDLIVAAWGAHGVHQGRGDAVRQMLPRLHYLRLTKDGHPGHPLYLPKNLTPAEWPYQRSLK